MSVILCKINSLDFSRVRRLILSDRLAIKIPGKPAKNAVKFPSDREISEAVKRGYMYYNAGTKTPHGYTIYPVPWQSIPDWSAFQKGYQDGVLGKKKVWRDASYTAGRAFGQQQLYRVKYPSVDDGEDW